MEIIFIPAGAFMMGSPDSDAEHGHDEWHHRVEIAKPFYMGRYEVTREQYCQVMETNPFRCRGDRKPVTEVSWVDAAAFCGKLSAKCGRIVRLPSEVEWEHACRAGTTTRFYYGDALSTSEANYRPSMKDESNNNTPPTPQKVRFRRISRPCPCPPPEACDRRCRSRVQKHVLRSAATARKPFPWRNTLLVLGASSPGCCHPSIGAGVPA